LHKNTWEWRVTSNWYEWSGFCTEVIILTVMEFAVQIRADSGVDCWCKKGSLQQQPEQVTCRLLYRRHIFRIPAGHWLSWL